MTEKARLTISSAAAAFVKAGVPKSEKLKAARGEVQLCPLDWIVMLVLMTRDSDPEVRDTAMSGLRQLTEEQLSVVVSTPAMHPQILDLLARLHFSHTRIASLIASHPNADEETLRFLSAKEALSTEELQEPRTLEASDVFAAEDEVEDVEVQPEEDEFRSKYQLAQVIGISDKIKYALTGDKEWRSIMIKDSNKLVSGAVLKNPRITDQEILSIAKSNMINEETVRTICNNKDWIKNYQVRKALVENNKTPLPFALRFLATLTEKDLSLIAKSKNVSTVIATQARKALIVLQKRR